MAWRKEKNNLVHSVLGFIQKQFQKNKKIGKDQMAFDHEIRIQSGSQSSKTGHQSSLASYVYHYPLSKSFAWVLQFVQEWLSCFQNQNESSHTSRKNNVSLTFWIACFRDDSMCLCSQNVSQLLTCIERL